MKLVFRRWVGKFEIYNEDRLVSQLPTVSVMSHFINGNGPLMWRDQVFNKAVMIKDDDAMIEEEVDLDESFRNSLHVKFNPQNKSFELHSCFGVHNSIPAKRVIDNLKPGEHSLQFAFYGLHIPESQLVAAKMLVGE